MCSFAHVLNFHSGILVRDTAGMVFMWVTWMDLETVVVWGALVTGAQNKGLGSGGVTMCSQNI